MTTEILSEINLGYLTRVMNNIVEMMSFPTQWKTARVILIPKPGKNGEQNSNYRPLSLIDSTAKLQEVLWRNRPTAEIEKNICYRKFHKTCLKTPHGHG